MAGKKGQSRPEPDDDDIMDEQDLGLDSAEYHAPVTATQSVNGQKAYTDQELEQALAEWQEKPMLIKFLTSSRLDDLLITSEIPSRLVRDIANIRVILEARQQLVQKIIRRARSLMARYEQVAARADEMLSNDTPDDDSTGRQLQAKARIDRMQAERAMQMAHHQIYELENETSLIEVWLRGFLQAMKARDRQFVNDLLNAYTAAVAAEESDKDRELEE